MTGAELDRGVRRELRTLSKDNASGVAAHLVMVGRLIDTELDAARAHAETAVRRAGRVAAVRETMGLVEYRGGRWAEALAEFRTARRIAGDQHLLPLMVDCERALGRPERALELASGPEARELTAAEQVELSIVVSGIRRDLGNLEAAALELRRIGLDPRRHRPWSARLFYAYADVLVAQGDEDGARVWFANAVDADTELETDAAERLDEIDGIVETDLLENETEDFEGERSDEAPDGGDGGSSSDVRHGGAESSRDSSTSTAPRRASTTSSGPTTAAGSSSARHASSGAGAEERREPAPADADTVPGASGPSDRPPRPAVGNPTWSDPDTPIATGRAAGPGAPLELSDGQADNDAGPRKSRWSRAASDGARGGESS